MSFDVVRSKAEALIATLTTPPVAYDNVHFDARDQDTWLRVIVEPADSFNKGIASDYEIRHVGIVVVAIHTRLKTGAAPVMVIANAVNDKFSNTRDGAVWFDQASVLRIGEIDDVYQVNVTIPFTYDEVTA